MLAGFEQIVEEEEINQQEADEENEIESFCHT